MTGTINSTIAQIRFGVADLSYRELNIYVAALTNMGCDLHPYLMLNDRALTKISIF